MRGASEPVIRLLGQVAVDAPDERQRLRPGKEQALLACLALQPNTSVGTGALVDEVWGDAAPSTALAIVHNYVARLRVLLDEVATIRTTGQGYRLEIDSATIDVHLARALRDEASAATAAGDSGRAIALLEQAIALWRGRPLDQLDAPFAATARADLETLHTNLVLDLAREHLAAGHAPESVLESLNGLVRDDPLDERAQGLFIRALHTAGRRADALAQYDAARRALAQELGVEPGVTLREVHALLLDSGAESPVGPAPAGASRRPMPTPSTRSWWRRHRWGSVAAALVVTGGLVTAVLVGIGSNAPSGGGRPAPPSTAPSDVTSTAAFPAAPIVTTYDLAQPSCCAITSDDVWGAGHHDNTLHEWSAVTGRPRKNYPVIGFQAGLPVAAAGSIWIPAPAGPLVRFDELTHRVTARIGVDGSQVTFGFGNMWETTRNHTLVEINLRTNKVMLRRRYASGINDWDDPLVTAPGAVWVADADAGQLLRFAPATGRLVARISGFGATDSSMPIAYGEGDVWVKRYVGRRELLFRIDPHRNAISGRVATTTTVAGGFTGSVAVGAGYVWTGNDDQTLSEIDPARLRVVRQFMLPGGAQYLVFTAGFLWIDGYDASQAWKIRVP